MVRLPPIPLTVLTASLLLLLVSCSPLPAPQTPPPIPPPTRSPTQPTIPTQTVTSLPSLTPLPSATATPAPLVPNFRHVVFILFENKEFGTIIGNPALPAYNRLAAENVLLSQHYAILHPSLPNYLALVGGDTFGVTTNYPQETVDAPILMDFLETSGRSWKVYQESMPAPCGTSDTLEYVQKHNPVIYFRSVRDNAERCSRSVVPLSDLFLDLQNNSLPDYVFITPNLCHSAHDTTVRPEECSLAVVDTWLSEMVQHLLSYKPLAEEGLTIITWDEGQGEHTCCGLETGGGRIPTVLISGLAKSPFEDTTPYTHYSLLRTIAEAWTLPALGYASDPIKAPLLTNPWKFD